MTNSRRTRANAATSRAHLVVTAVLVLLSVPWAYGQESEGWLAAREATVKHASQQLVEVTRRQYALATPIEVGYAANEALRFKEPWTGRRFGTPGSFGRTLQQQPPSPRLERSTTRKVLGAIVGGAGGFFGGGLLGAMIESKRCSPCDDPEIVGFIVGAPIGGTVGSILGYKFLF